MAAVNGHLLTAVNDCLVELVVNSSANVLQTADGALARARGVEEGEALMNMSYAARKSMSE
jgi:hypothetical protein